MLYVAAIGTVALSMVVAGVNYWVGKHFHVAERTRTKPRLTRWYWTSLPVALLLGLVFYSVGYRAPR